MFSRLVSFVEEVEAANSKKKLDQKMKARYLRDMVSSPGWEIVEEWMSQQVTGGLKRLLHCPAEEIAALRGELRALDRLRGFIRLSLTEASRALEEAEEREEQLLKEEV